MMKTKKTGWVGNFLIFFAIFTIGFGAYNKLFAGSEKAYKHLKLFTEIMESIEEDYVEPVETEKLIEAAAKGMVTSLDPHSDLLTPKALKQLEVSTKGEFGGLGIILTMRDGVLTVVSPIEGTPAYKIGVESNDMIIKIDDKSTREMDLSEAVSLMRGKKGTSVVITIVRKEEPKPIEFKIIRDIIPIHSVKSTMLQNGYGYLRITNFQAHTAEDVIKALKDMEAANNGLKGLLLDLRNNPGGLLEQSVAIADLFLEEGDILSIKGRSEDDYRVYHASKSKTKREYPMVVLVNGGSASASEILAGALQDNKRAAILGTTTFGKGSVQNVKTIMDGNALKLTIARYYTPSGRSIQAKGIEPDINVPYVKLPESKNSENSLMIKEKDLTNHMEAEPEKEKKSEDDEVKSVYGKLSIEDLLADNQVIRALDILVGYNIFTNTRK